VNVAPALSDELGASSGTAARVPLRPLLATRIGADVGTLSAVAPFAELTGGFELGRFELIGAFGITGGARERGSARARSEPARTGIQHRGAAPIDAFLASLDDNERNVFILSELEQMSAPEIATALQVKLNTVYSCCALPVRRVLATVSGATMKEMEERARQLLDMARAGHNPRPGDATRVRAALKARVLAEPGLIQGSSKSPGGSSVLRKLALAFGPGAARASPRGSTSRRRCLSLRRWSTFRRQ
jgi:hypothetical protein